MEALKNCPFCGGEAVFTGITNFSTNYSAGFEFGVECVNCAMKLPSQYKLELDLRDDGRIEILNDGRSEAVEAWNRRQGTN